MGTSSHGQNASISNEGYTPFAFFCESISSGNIFRVIAEKAVNCNETT